MRSTIIGSPTIIGTRKDGRPIYLIQGAEDGGDKGAGGDGSGTAGGGSGSGSGDGGTGDGTDGGGDKSGDQGTAGKYDHITDVAALRKLIEQRETEAAAAGGKARDTARARAAAEAKAQATADIAKLLGLTPDDKDPAKLESEVQQLRTQNIARDRELLVYRQALAPNMGVNVSRLTDSRSFMAQVDAIDPTADDAPARITALIKAAVTSDQSLRAAQVRGGSVDHGQGPGDNHSPDLSKSHGADLLAGAYAANASKATN